MIEALAVSLLLTLVAVIGVAFWAVTKTVEDHQHYLTEQAKRHHAERMALIDERDALLERIQRPEYRPTPRRDEEPTEMMELPELDMAMVGTVVSEAPDGE